MYDFKYANIPLDRPLTKDDIPHLKEQLSILKNRMAVHDNTQAAVKIILNSIYGVAGYKKFIGYNKDVAQTITAQCADLIHYTIDVHNDYFMNDWADDHDTHKKMGITYAENSPVEVVTYAVTDSVFVTMSHIYNNQKGYDGSMTQFILDINEHKLEEYTGKKLYDYCVIWGASTVRPGTNKPVYNLEIEEILYSQLSVGKNRYAKDVAWADGKTFEPQSKISIKGLELFQQSIPKVVREKSKEILYLILSIEDDSEIEPVVIGKIIEFKNMFTVWDVDQISKTTRVNGMANWTVKSTDKLVLVSGCSAHVKGAAHYNYLLYNNPQYKNKYDFITDSTKVNWYYSMESNGVQTFAYPKGSYPFEFAPPVNINLQFEKLVISPITNTLKALNINTKHLNSNFISYYDEIF